MREKKRADASDSGDVPRPLLALLGQDYEQVVRTALVEMSRLLDRPSQVALDDWSVSARDIVHDGIMRILLKDVAKTPGIHDRQITRNDLSRLIAGYARNVFREGQKRRAVCSRIASKLTRELESRGAEDSLDHGAE